MPWPTDPARAALRRAVRPAAHCSAALAAALLAAGCTTPPTPASAPAPSPPEVSVVPVYVPAPPPPVALPPAPDPADAAARRLLAFHERLRTMGTPELAREYLRLSEAAGPPESLELALLLAQRRANGDLARAVTLLEPLLRDDAAGPWAAPSRLLHARLAEQRRLEEQVERQGQQLRDQQRRIEQLASQLEALRAIERSLTTRPPAPAVPGAAAPRPAP